MREEAELTAEVEMTEAAPAATAAPAEGMVEPMAVPMAVVMASNPAMGRGAADWGVD